MGTPRMSLSQLSEYLTAGPSRRKSIIIDAADPKPYIASTYNAASSAISADMLGGAGDNLGLTAQIEALSKKLKSPLPDWQIQHIKLCLEALKIYAASKNGWKLGEWEMLPANIGPKSMNIAGVRIGISPEAILRKTAGNLINIGCLKFYFAKSKPLSKERAAILGAVMHWYAEKHLGGQGLADHKSSIIIDLPGSAVHLAPKAVKTNRKNIEAACEEIVARWPEDAPSADDPF